MSLDASWNLQALSALDISAMAASENIANASTENYRPRRVDLEDGPGGKGVLVADIVELSGTMGHGLTGAEGPGYPMVPQGRPTDYESGMIRPVASSNEGNGVDIAREMVDLIRIERAYSANVETIREMDQTVGQILNIVA